MDFSLTANYDFLPNDLRVAYEHRISEEVATRSPAEAAKLLNKKEPKQLEFKFTTS